MVRSSTHLGPEIGALKVVEVLPSADIDTVHREISRLDQRRILNQLNYGFAGGRAAVVGGRIEDVPGVLESENYRNEVGGEGGDAMTVSKRAASDHRSCV